MESPKEAKQDPFTVVIFRGEELEDGHKAIDLVQSNWTFRLGAQVYCRYPPKKFYPLLDDWLKNGKNPGDDWESFPVNVFATAINLSQGKRRLIRAYEESDVNSTDGECHHSFQLPRTLSRVQVKEQLRKISQMSLQDSSVKPKKSADTLGRGSNKVLPADIDSVKTRTPKSPHPRKSLICELIDNGHSSSDTDSSSSNHNLGNSEVDSFSSESSHASNKSMRAKKPKNKTIAKDKKGTVLSSAVSPDLKKKRQKKTLASLQDSSVVKSPSKVGVCSGIQASGRLGKTVDTSETVRSAQGTDTDSDDSLTDITITPTNHTRRRTSGNVPRSTLNPNICLPKGSRTAKLGQRETDNEEPLTATPSKIHLNSRDFVKRKLLDRSLGYSDDEEDVASPRLLTLKKMKRAVSLDLLTMIKATIKEEIRANVKSIQIDLRNQTKELKNMIAAKNVALAHGPNLTELKGKLSVTIPIETLDGFTDYEQSVKNDPEGRDALLNFIRILIYSPNLKMKECVASVLSAIITKAVQLEYSAFGREDKKDFSATQTYRALQDSMIEKFGQNWDQKEFRTRVSKWFSGAADRDGGRRNRQRKRRSRSA